jgi:hypothetical protein
MEKMGEMRNENKLEINYCGRDSLVRQREKNSKERKTA